MVTCGSAFPAEGGLEPWCTSGLLSFQAIARHFLGGLSGAHHRTGDTTHQPRAPHPGMFPCRKQSFWKVTTPRLYSETSSLAVSASTVCVARPVQLMVICSLW